MIGGVGVGIGISVGALLAADMGGAGISGLASSAAVIGGALLAVPATRLMRTGGRRPGLVFAYLVGALGALVVVAGASADLLGLVFLGTLLFGGGTAANLQARYTAVDLADPAVRGKQLSVVVWATTIGAVAGPILAPVADRAVRGWGIREYAGPFVFSALAFGLGAALLFVLLRPDPLQLARKLELEAQPPEPPPPVDPSATDAAVAGAAVARPVASETETTGGLRAAWRAVRGNPAARLGMSAVAVGHLVMVGVMSMTPVHINDGGHDHADVLKIVSIVLSLHIAGMYALSPVMGFLVDRLGRRPVVLLGIGLLVAACAVAGSAGHATVRLSIGLALLGLGWSATMVAGSTLLTEAVDVVVRPAAQGLNDMAMGFAGAMAGALSGVVVAIGSYGTLALLSGMAVLPLLALALRSDEPPRA
ncbi:tetracycline resistance protein [Virgisporangium aurantiacum]|uniref:Tetracycline resistance protein n=1 Tax=Virgisporangium aurantiacum TaxID=175570 RepID=A0A8J4DYB5_9ACTN|nr:tetracycline resistance protein [Virgisporangium aurantiacum]